MSRTVHFGFSILLGLFCFAFLVTGLALYVSSATPDVGGADNRVIVLCLLGFGSAGGALWNLARAFRPSTHERESARLLRRRPKPQTVATVDTPPRGDATQITSTAEK